MFAADQPGWYAVRRRDTCVSFFSSLVDVFVFTRSFTSARWRVIKREVGRVDVFSGSTYLGQVVLWDTRSGADPVAQSSLSADGMCASAHPTGNSLDLYFRDQAFKTYPNPPLRRIRAYFK